jgi:hypothetical protein
VTEERVLKVTGERVGVVRELAGIQALLDGSPRRDLSDGAERSGVGLQNFSYFCRLQRVDIDLVEIKTEIPKFHPALRTRLISRTARSGNRGARGRVYLGPVYGR